MGYVTSLYLFRIVMKVIIAFLQGVIDVLKNALAFSQIKEAVIEVRKQK